MKINAGNDLSGKTIKDILTKELKFSSRMIKKLKYSENGITVNGNKVTVRYSVKENDIIELCTEDLESEMNGYNTPSDIPLDVLYEDGNITIINKAPGMPSHTSLGHKDDSVANAMAFKNIGRNYVFRPINRLDIDTSGCMIIANTKDASYKFGKMMKERKIKKLYLALVSGSLEKEEGTMRSFIRRENGSIITRCETDENDPEGQEALTYYRKVLSSQTVSLYLLMPLTGRTHQLRVQLSSRGCPIIGDDMYGGDTSVMKRQALHSFITYIPAGEFTEEITVTASVPEDIKKSAEIFGIETEEDSIAKIGKEIVFKMANVTPV